MADQTPRLWWAPSLTRTSSPAASGLLLHEHGQWHRNDGYEWEPWVGDLPDDAVLLVSAEPVDDKGRTPTYLRGFADGRMAGLAGAGKPPAAEELTAYLHRYGASWELSHEDGVRVWNDPDGGELRIVQALRRLLQETDHTDVRAIVGDVFAAPGANDRTNS